MELTKDNLTKEELKERLNIRFEAGKITVDEPTYEIMSEEEMITFNTFFARECPSNGAPPGIGFSYEPFGFSEILDIKDVKYTSLISAFHRSIGAKVDDDFTTIFLEEDEIPERYRISNEKPFTIYGNYLSPNVKITIQPLEIYHTHSNTISKYYTVGYLLWQTIKVYRDIFIYHKKEVEPGHAWDELAAGSFSLLDSNIGYMSFQS